MPAVQAVSVSNDPQVYEDEHVHSVYDEIAPHFSSTRYKPWPIIAQFLSSLPAGWVGLDSGTGNGKYLPLPQDRPGRVWSIGLDKSRKLLEIAQSAGGVRREVVWGDILERPWRAGAFDYAISIATIHHLSTPARRQSAVQRLIESLSPTHGRALVYVWAIEQDELSKRAIPAESESGVTTTATSARGQDVFVPWVLSSPSTDKAKSKIDAASQDAQTTSDTHKVFHRYYHMFAHGELRQLVEAAALELGLVIGSPAKTICRDSVGLVQGVDIVQDGWERSNYYIEMRRWECPP